MNKGNIHEQSFYCGAVTGVLVLAVVFMVLHHPRDLTGSGNTQVGWRAGGVARRRLTAPGAREHANVSFALCPEC